MTTEANQYFNRLKHKLVEGLNTIAIGEIVNFDPIKMKADVAILPEEQIILDVPVGMPQTDDFYIRIPYKKGNKVVIAFAQRDIDEIMYGGKATATERMLSIDDAIVMCGVNLFTDSLPAEDADKLVLAEKNGGAKIAIGQGEVNVTGVFKVNGNVVGGS